jgi:hypothetical protein
MTEWWHFALVALAGVAVVVIGYGAMILLDYLRNKQ